MNTLPTKLAVELAKASDLSKVLRKGNEGQTPSVIRNFALAAFQQMALAGDLDDCMRAIAPYLGGKLNQQHKQCLELIFTLTRKDVLGQAVEGLMEVATNSRNSKDKVTAATILHELYGEKQLINEESLTDKLVVNLVSKD